MRLSLAVITYNEQENIARLLESVKGLADEVVVVDSLSTDKTKEVCLRICPEIRFFEKKFNGYGEQKNYALDLCSGDWILFLDADEVPDSQLIQSIKKIVTTANPQYAVYNVHYKNHLGHYIIKHGGWGSVYRERLFRKGLAHYSNEKVHESLVTKEKSGLLKGRLDHYTYKSIHHHVSKINTYSDLMAEKMLEKGKKIKRMKIIVSPAFEFIKVFILKLGFLDGFAGFYVAKTMSYYTFLKYIKLREKIRIQERNRS